MSESKITSYLLYAFGEIFLVVIGILIAVNINNWNGERKQRSIEKKYFLNLKNDLQADIVGIDTIMNFGNRKIMASKNIRKRVNNDSIGSLYDFSNVIKDLILVGEFRPNQFTFEEMQSSGHFSNLKNDSLKSKLLALKRTYEILDSGQEHIRNDYNVFLENFEQHVDWGSYYDLNKSKIPEYFEFDSTTIEGFRKQMEMDVHTLFDDKIFLNNIFLIELNFTYFDPVFDGTKYQIQEIIDLIDLELDK